MAGAHRCPERAGRPAEGAGARGSQESGLSPERGEPSGCLVCQRFGLSVMGRTPPRRVAGRAKQCVRPSRGLIKQVLWEPDSKLTVPASSSPPSRAAQHARGDSV